MGIGDAAVLDTSGLDALIRKLRQLGYETTGPVVRDGAIMPGPITGAADLPEGYHDEQAPGRYRLEQGADGAFFGWAVGPGSWKAALFPPTQELWHTEGTGDMVRMVEGDHADEEERAPLAMVGARPCELAGLSVLDRVLEGGVVPDPRYARRRAGAFVVVVECGKPAATCFCTSMGTGPGAKEGFDLALTELLDDDGHRFLARAGTERGAELLSHLPHTPARATDDAARRQVLQDATASVERRLEADGVRELLARNLQHPRWDEVAERCLACGNCTLVCPTCFCSDVVDTTDLHSEVHRTRTWASCFDLDHSYLNGGPVRASVSSRYRQWLTHKLSTWWDQFDSSGCVGCGRCIAWCPVGIDLTEEVAAIAATDGAARVRGAASVDAAGATAGGARTKDA